MEWLIYQHGNWMSRTKGVKDVTEKEGRGMGVGRPEACSCFACRPTASVQAWCPGHQ